MSILKTIFNVFHSTFFRPEKFYCRIDLGSGIIYKVYERPGIWMSKEDLELLTNDIHQVAISGQGEKDIPDYGVLKGNSEDLINRVITIGYEKKTGKPVGFAAQIFWILRLG